MMPSTTIQLPRNPSEWLLPDPGRATDLAEQAISEPVQAAPSSILAQLGKIAKASLARQIVDAFAQIIPSDLIDVLRGAWADYRTLVEVGTQSAQQAPGRRIVTLSDQQVAYEQEPSFAVVVNESPVLTLVGRVALVLSLSNTQAIVHAGRLVRVHAGHIAVTGTVELEGQVIAEKTLPWSPDFVVDFEPGVDLTASAVRWSA